MKLATKLATNLLLVPGLLLCAMPVGAQTLANSAKASAFPLATPEEAAILAGIGPMKLDFDGVTLRAALQELQRQSGVALDLSRETPAKTLDALLSLQLETRSFDRAFAAIMDSAGVRANLRRYDTNQPWSVVWGESDESKNALQSQTELFAARLTQLSSMLSKTVTLKGSEDARRSQNSGLNLSIALRPDLRWPLIDRPKTRLTRAQDEAGRSLLIANDANVQVSSYSSNADGWHRSFATLRLKAPEADTTKLAHLEGATVYTLVSATETWRVPDLPSQKEWKRSFGSGDQKFYFTLRPTLQSETRLALKLEVNSTLPATSATIDHPMLADGALLRTLRVVGANGVTLSNDGYDRVGNAGNMTLNTEFYDRQKQALALPLQLIFDAPIEWVQTEVPFSFTDVPLP